MPDRKRISGLPAQLALAIVYVAAAQLGFWLATIHPVVASVWPPAGLALGVLLLFGIRLWPGLLLGALVANAMKGIPVGSAMVIASGNTLATVVGALVLRRLDCQVSLQRVKDALILLGAGALCVPLIAATLGTLGLYLAGAPTPSHSAIWLTWWSGDAVGIMLVTPLILAWMQGGRPERPGRLGLEVAMIGLSLLLSSIVLFRVLGGYEYAVVPLVGWAALRWGPRGASAGTILVAMVAMWYTVHGVGPFHSPGSDGLWRLQLFLALLTAGSLVIGAMATALRASELRFRRIFENAGVGIAVVHPDGRIGEANPAFQGMLGFSGAELSGRTIASITHPDDWAVEQQTGLEDLLAGGPAPLRAVKRYLRRDGTVFWGKLTATHISGRADAPGFGIGLVEDISEQRAAEQSLRETTQMLQTLVDASPLAIYTLDAEGRVRTWNHAAEQMFGWAANEVIDRLLPIVPPEALDAFGESLRGALDKAVTGLQVRRCRRDGLMLDLRICTAPTRGSDGSIDGVIVLAEDVTERKSLGEQLRQAQKMEAVGQLTGGIAHDFNNLLTVVITNAALLAEEIPPDRVDMRGDLSELQRAALRGAQLVRKLMAFSRRRAIELSAVDLVGAVGDTERALRRLLPGSVEVSSQLEAGPLTISGDVGGIEQILFNLATNARDAMPDGGTLRLGVYRAWLDEEHRRTHGWGVAGAYIVVAVSDTGCGMSPETQARIFEPFFTTKEQGKGTGLGMSMVYGLMKQHNGYIGLYSELGHGTTIRLYFPAVASSLRACDVEPATVPRGGTERILVVDDEPGIRRSAARALTRYGYDVDEAQDGEGALEALRRSKTGYDLILSDLIMPRMGGLALYEELAKHFSGSRVLLMSGYTAEDVHALSDANPGLRLLHKPWTMTDLLRRVREVLDIPPQALLPLQPRVEGAA